MTAVEQVEFSAEMHSKFRQYGSYVNASRAIPDVRDGLRPVHRRILWGMYEMGARPGKGKYKSMDAIGQVSRYHPHGDSALYGAMATVAHVESEGLPFRQPLPLIDAQGSWGDLVEGPAAPRYTECSLHEHGMALLGADDSIEGGAEIAEDGVDKIANYSGRYDEPTVLPARWPAFVVNGQMGIGVGIAMSTPAHNLREVMNLAIKLVDTPNPRMETVLSIMPGPDPACDADIFDDHNGFGIESYYETGYGRFFMRAKIDTADVTPPRARTKQYKLSIHSLPWSVSPESVVGGIQEMIAREMLPPMEVVNLSDMRGVNIVLEIGSNDPEDVIQRLLFHSGLSKLQTSFSVNSHAIVKGRIQNIGVLDAIREWIAHRRQVVVRRSKFRLKRAEARMEIVDGYLTAIPQADKIVEMIRKCDGRKEAEERLQQPEWGFTAPQAAAIMDLTLSQITRLSANRYQDERDNLKRIIDECREIISDPAKLDSVIKSEMRAVRDRYGTDRRCTIREGSSVVSAPETPAVEIPAVNGYLAVTGRNWIRWVRRDNFNRTLAADYVTQVVPCTDQNMIECITDWGYHSRNFMSDVPKDITNSSVFFNDVLDQGERPITVATASVFNSPDLMMVTSYGKVKRVAFDVWANHRANKPFQVINMEEPEYVRSAFFVPGDREVEMTILTSYGRALRFDVDDVAAKGKGAKGITGANLEGSEDDVVWAGITDPDDQILFWTGDNKVGRYRIGDVPRSSRGTKGRTFNKSDFTVSGALLIPGDSGHDHFGMFGPGMDEPKSMPLEEIPLGRDMDDDSLLKVRGVISAAAHWSF